MDAMRIDLDTCRDPELLAGEVRRLQAVIASEQTLTDLERVSISRAIETLEGVEYIEAFATENDATAANALRGLLERTLTTHTNHANGSVQDSVT